MFKAPDGSWDVVKERAGKGAKAVRPSEINHGNIAPTVQLLGITCDYAEHTAVLSFAGLRRLGFGGGPKDEAGRALLAALGVVALAEQDARGYALRSRCDLVCEGRTPYELVHADGATERLEKRWKLRYQMSSSPSCAGRLRSSGVSAKWRSIACAPASSARKLASPMAIAIGRPMALHIE